MNIRLMLTTVLFGCLLVTGCVVDNPSKRSDTPPDDAGISNIDGGIQCETTCDVSECPSGSATQNSECLCICDVVCDDDCPAIACGPGQALIQLDGECCPSCIDQCGSTNDCAPGERCTSDGICAPNCDECGECEAGLLPSPNELTCCACVPECGDDSPYACAEGLLCVDETCQPVETCDVVCECPQGTEPSEVIAEGECCPECVPLPCADIFCEMCPPGTEPVPAADSCCDECVPVDDCLCPEVFAPVCGTDGLTYTNSCFARCAQVGIRREGECANDCGCPEVYEPVCAGGIDYANRCLANCANARDVEPGECGDTPLCSVEDGCGRACDTAINCLLNQCGAVERDERRSLFEGCRDACNNAEFSTEELCAAGTCENVIAFVSASSGEDLCAEIACQTPTPGVDYYAYGAECDLMGAAAPCDPDQSPYRDACGCGCIDFDPACTEPLPPGTDYVALGEECSVIDFECAAGYEAFYNECGCGCAFSCDCDPSVGPDVCTDEGVRYQSQCEASCAGIDEMLPACPRTCDCPTRYAPVCGLDGNTYDNGCQARCANVEIAYRGECAPPPLECPIDADYINEDPEACALIGAFTCDPGFEPFSNECGCGCAPNICPIDGIEAVYINEDPEVCALISVDCPDGRSGFNDACGCGCYL